MTAPTGTIGMFRFFWRLLTPGQRRQLVTLEVLTIAMGFSTLGGIAAIAPFFIVLGDPSSIGRYRVIAWLRAAAPDVSDHGFLVLLAAGFVLTVLLANAINLLGQLAIHRFSLRVGSDLQVALFEEYLSRDYLFHARGNSTALANNIVYETTRVTGGVLQNGLLLVSSLFGSLLIVASIVFVDATIAAAAAATFGLVYVVIYLLARRRLARHGDTEVKLFDARARTLNEGFGAIREVLLSRGQGFFRDALERQSRQIARASNGTLAITLSPRYILEFVAAAGLAAAALVMSGRDSAGWVAKLGFLALAAYRLLPALQQAFAALARVRADEAAFRKIADDLARSRARAREPRAVSPEWRARPRRDIVLRDVSFQYDARSEFAIRGASLRIAAGTTAGLVGSNGSGKTTLAELILGLLTPASGSIEIDGELLDDSVRAAWQSNVAYVPQHVFLLDASVAENIALGSRDIDLARVREAARVARLEDLLDSARGFEASLGERGARLSGGQRQRIGIARALYRNASLLVFDEATSALDGLSEQEIVAALAALRGERTILLLAHRLQSLVNCDQIFECQAGAIIARGDFSQFRAARTA